MNTKIYGYYANCVRVIYTTTRYKNQDRDVLDEFKNLMHHLSDSAYFILGGALGLEFTIISRLLTSHQLLSNI
jgi:hypothetical protein